MTGKHHLSIALGTSVFAACVLARPLLTGDSQSGLTQHVLAWAGALAGVLHRPLPHWTPDYGVWLVGAGIVGGLLPDLDEPESTISNAPRVLARRAHHLLRHLAIGPMRPLVWLIGTLLLWTAAVLNVLTRASSRVFRFLALGHREGSHWLPVWVLLSMAAYPLTFTYASSAAALGFSIGYLSHLVADGVTKTGIPLIPRSGLRLHLLPAPLRIRTGSHAESWMASLYLVAVGILTVGMFVP